MIFSTEFWGLALLWAFIAACVSAALAYTGGDKSVRAGKTVTPGSTAIAAAAITFPIALLLVRFLMYYAQPSFQGAYFGYLWVLVCALTPALGIGLLMSTGGSRSGSTGS